MACTQKHMETRKTKPAWTPVGRGRGNSLFFAMVLGLSFFCATGLDAQDESFTASAPAVVQLGEQFQYVIEGPRRGDVTLPPLDGFQLLAGPFSSISSHSQWVNGKMSMETSVTYTHILRPVREGTFTLPPATVRAGRKEFKTNEVQITVSGAGTQASPQPGPGGGTAGEPGQAGSEARESPADDPVFLRVIPSKRNVYVGEQFVSGLKVYTRVNTRPASAAKDLPYEGFYKTSLDPDASAQRQDINGQQYVTQVIQRHILIPQKSGDITIDPYESDWMIQQRVQRRSSSIFDDFFDDPFFSGVQEVPQKLATLPVTIHVKPLPPGAPEGFTGAVGDFNMKAELSTEELEVNEALSLKVTIRGTGNLPLLGAPEVNLPLDHDLYDVTRSVNTTTSGNRISGSVTFEYPIVVRHAGRFRIAPVRFAWFDPASGHYETASTREFSFTVLKGESGEMPANAYVPGIIQESVSNIGTDIRDITRAPVQLMPLAYTLMGQRWYRMLFLLAGLLAIAVIVLIRTLTRRNADLSLVRNRQANRTARSRLRKADSYRKSGDQDGFYEEVGKAIWGYMSDKLNIETSALSRDLIQQELAERGVGEDLLGEWSRILDESEFSRFAPSAEKSDVEELYRDAARLIRNLENSL
jgi:hypothetical protein